jgi:hypothetical protein
MAAGIFQLGAAAGKVLLCGLQNNGQGHKTIKATVHTDKKNGDRSFSQLFFRIEARH